MKTISQILGSQNVILAAALPRTATSILSPPAPASSNQRVNEILGIEPVRATWSDAAREAAKLAIQNHKGSHVIYDDGRPGHQGSKAKILHKDEKGMQVQFEDRASPTRIGYHDDAWMKHLKPHAEASDATADDAVTARATGDVVHCRAASDILGAIATSEQPWKQGQECRLEYMPAGTHTICAGFRSNSILLTVEVDPERDTPVVNASFQNLVAKYPKQKPFGCIEHEEKDASVWAKGFEPSATGINLIAEPSALGENHVNGRIHRSWSPSFLTDADYTKATLKEYPSGKVYEFPAGVRGSEQNPARITGVTFCVGTLTNNPAFKEINPVRAKEMAITMSTETKPEADKVTAGAPAGNKNAAGHHAGMHPSQIKFAAAKALHETLKSAANEEKAKLPPYPHEGTEEEQLEHASKEVHIEHKHGVWDAFEAKSKAEKELHQAARAHMERQPVYQNSAEKEKLVTVWDRAWKNPTHREKMTDIAMRLNFKDGVQPVTATARTVSSILGTSRVDAVLVAKTPPTKETKNISGVTRTASTILASTGKATSAHSQKTT